MARRVPRAQERKQPLFNLPESFERLSPKRQGRWSVTALVARSHDNTNAAHSSSISDQRRRGGGCPSVG